MEAPKVSVCCVAYQQRPYIAEALEAILGQRTDLPFEVIVHDDASTDGTGEVIRDYAARFPDQVITIIQKENQYSQGGRPRLLCMARARGAYIALCDGDDVWTDPLKLQKQVDLLEAEPEAAGVYHYTEAKRDGRFTGKVYGEHAGRLSISVEDTFSTVSPLHISSFMFRRNGLVIPDWFHRVISTDMALYSVVAARGPLRCIPEVMATYRQHASNMTGQPLVQERFHQQRIGLMRLLDDHHHGAFHPKAMEVIAFHEAAIKKDAETARAKGSVMMRLRNLLHR
jgi:glycosyltransferase involved in cell wall biosynthesis